MVVLFHATNFQSLMYPCFTFCRILGIFPCKINISSFKIYKPYYFLSTIVAGISCIFALITVMDISGWYGILDERRNIEITCIHILYNIILVVTFISSSLRMRLLQTILTISSGLSSEIYRKLSMLIHSKDIFSFLFILFYILIRYYYVQYGGVLEVYYLYTTLLVFQMDMLYINCVCILKACFKGINDDLANLIVNNESHIIKWINHKQRNSLLLMKLKVLKKQHLMVSDTVQKLNIIFSPQLLVTTVLIFITITFEVYFKFVHYRKELSINLSYRISLPYIACMIVKIALITWACETSKNQAKEISTTVHDVLNSTNDEKIKNELRVFSLQILHSDNTFWAKGLTINATILTDMIGTVTTYILILIQFLYM